MATKGRKAIGVVLCLVLVFAVAVVAERGTKIREAYADVLRNLLDNGNLPDGGEAELPITEYTQFAISDVDGDGKEELVLLYDPGVVAGEVGYIIGYDKDRKDTYIQLEEFPAFVFLENGNIRALCSHNQSYGEMWPYSLYQYLPEKDSYEKAGFVSAEDKMTLKLIGMERQYPDEVDISQTGTVYYIGEEGWGTEPMDESDFLKWLEENHGNGKEREIPFLSLTEENIKEIEC